MRSRMFRYVYHLSDYDDMYEVEVEMSDDEFALNTSDDSDDTQDTFENFYSPEDVLNYRFIQPLGSNLIFTDYISSEAELRAKILARTYHGLKSNYRALAEKMGNLFNDKNSSDIILQVNEKTFYVHRLILYSWSPVFKTMIGSPNWRDTFRMSHTEEDRFFVKISEDIGNFEEFLKFMYTEKVTADLECLWNLVYLADKYIVTELSNACSNCLINYIASLPVGEKMVRIMNEAGACNMIDVYETAWQKVQKNLFFFTEALLPILGEDQLHDALESSDLVADDEYRLLQKLLPWFQKLFENGKTEVVQKLINQIRFTQMSGRQLQDFLRHVATSFTFLEPIKVKVTDALLHRCSLWDRHTHKLDLKGPRLYLKPPPPFLTKYDGKLSFHPMSFSDNPSETWKYFLQLKLTPLSKEIIQQRSKFLPYVNYTEFKCAVKNCYHHEEDNSCVTIESDTSYPDDQLFFARENDNRFQWTFSSNSSLTYHGYQRNGLLHFKIQNRGRKTAMENYTRSEATVVIVVHTEPSDSQAEPSKAYAERTLMLPKPTIEHSEPSAIQGEPTRNVVHSEPGKMHTESSFVHTEPSAVDSDSEEVHHEPCVIPTDASIVLAESSVVNLKPRYGVESVLSETVPIHINPNLSTFKFEESQQFKSGVNVPLKETKYVTFFVFAKQVLPVEHSNLEANAPS